MAATSPCRTILFAKAPVAGAVKTRLIPALGANGAAQLHRQLVERLLETLIAADVGPVELCCAPDASHPFFDVCEQRFGVALTRQGEGDLGERMREALVRALQTSASAIIVGADCPSVTVSDIREAAAKLADHDATLIPADDGGYVLIGVRRAQHGMFDAIDWGSATVLAAQRGNFRTLDWRWHEGAARWDVDRPEDLARLAELVPPMIFEPA